MPDHIDHDYFNQRMEEERAKRLPKKGQRVLVTGGAGSGFSGEYVGEETTLVGVLQRVELDNGMATLVSVWQMKIVDGD